MMVLRTKAVTSLFVVSLLLASVSVLGTPLAPSASASVPSPTSDIAKHAFGYINTIRNYFFCVSSTCKKNRASDEVASGKAMKALMAEARALSGKVWPTKERAVATKFVTDVNALSNAYLAYPKESSAQAIARNTASIYYQSANVGSDTYVMTAAVKGSPVKLPQWSVGAVAVLYAMQLDTQALNAKSATAADALYASQNLEHEAATLSADANGPNAQFNTLITTFARTQLTVSTNAIALLEHKKVTLSNGALSALSTMLGQQFTQIVTLEKKLVKKK
ncbi:MAG: hypothetical protein ACYC1I_00085 [Acidimicrobiales bacterium]